MFTHFIRFLTSSRSSFFYVGIYIYVEQPTKVLVTRLDSFLFDLNSDWRITHPRNFGWKFVKITTETNQIDNDVRNRPNYFKPSLCFFFINDLVYNGPRLMRSLLLIVIVSEQVNRHDFCSPDLLFKLNCPLLALNKVKQMKLYTYIN